MTQKHYAQHGVFHVISNAYHKDKILTVGDTPIILIDNIWMTRNIHKAEVYAFCIMPSHMHLLMKPGEKGLSCFMHSLKRNSSRDIHMMHPPAVAEVREPPLRRPKPFWQKGFYDERIRSPKQRSVALAYIHNNPLADHLVSEIYDWPWSSLQYKNQLDPMNLWHDSPFDVSII